MPPQTDPAAGPSGRPDGVAIVGMAALFPGAPDLATFWANVSGGVDAITDVPEGRWDPVFFDADAKGADRFYVRRGGFVDAFATFDPLAFGIMPNAVDAIEPDQLLALAAADAALRDAGSPLDRSGSGGSGSSSIDPTRVSVILGRGGYLGDGVARLDQRVRTAQQLVEALRSLLPGIDEDRLAAVKAEFQERLGPERPESSIGLVPNLAASRIANRFDLRGPAYTVDAACASSLIAVDHAVAGLRSGAVDLALAGGVHHCHDLTLWSVFCQLHALSPTEQIRPFSADADGILVGEGTGIFVLKREADAVRDGDRIYAVIRGTGVASDGAGASLMNPRAEGQVLAVRQAWAASGLDPSSVGLIEAHGTATPVGDRTEVETLRTVFGDHGPAVGLGSVKSMIGHAMPAAGAAGLAKAALAIHHGVLPPTLHAAEPNEALAGSRFRLVQSAEAWAPGDDGLRVAGVNAFGFGGINAHVVLTSLPPESAGEGVAGSSVGRATYARTEVGAGDAGAGDDVVAEVVDEEVVLLAGADAADLLAQLDGAPAKAPGGPARLAMVAPDDRRRTLARKVLERGTPFRGRNEVWFEPGDGTGIAGAKVAYLFPGVEPVFEPRVDDVAERLGLPWEGLTTEGSALERQGRGIVQVGRLLADALDRLGIAPDAIAGHSLGEWTGQIVSGQIPDSYVDEFLHSLEPGSIEVSDVVFVALGAGADVAAELVDGLADAHVSHDNCPHQSVICAPPEAMAVAVERAKERKVLAQELPFRSGFHSPLFAPLVDAMADTFGHIPLEPVRVPLWSATSVSPYPAEAAAVAELSGRHLVEPVRFRELVEALYDDGVRAFVQVGTGSLLGFVDDTLRDRDVLTVTANAPRQTGVGQLRRVAAALWTLGVDVDWSVLEGSAPRTDEAPAAEPHRPSAARPLVLGSTLIRDLTPLDLPVRDGGHAGFGALDDGLDGFEDLIADPLLGEYRAGVADAQAAALEVLRAAAVARRPKAPSLREAVWSLSVEDQPYWFDHAFYEQPEGWTVVEDLFPLVPMTGIIEKLMDEAVGVAPGQVPVRVEGIRAFRWLAVHPPTAVTVRVSRDGDQVPGVETAVKASIDGHARATVVCADRYPAPPPPAAQPIHGHVDNPATPVEVLYSDRHLFHGPEYQGVRRFDDFGDDGVSGLLEAGSAPGALLDNAGQLFGFWLAQRVDKDRLVLPTSIDRISFYGPLPARGTEVRCVVNATSITDQSVRADLELTVDGVVWCRIEGWEDRRFQSDDRLFTLLRKPSTNLLAEPQPEGWVLVREGWPDSASRDVVMRRFLGRAERHDYDARNPNVQRTWLLGRIAAKDAVRHLLWCEGEGAMFPVEVGIANDAEGRPLATVAGDDPPDVRISIAHTAGLGVAVAAVGVDVGIDIEKVEPRPDTFEATALSKKERKRLDEVLPHEGSDARAAARVLELTRWWAAKEAAAKAAGTGMQGRPKDFKVEKVRGQRLRIGDRWVATRLVHEGDDTYVVAWTEEADD
jgi:acyl transferase domain-containing protein/phosphopantetheinyl transferase (holo-ACP synthase)